ncbi:hypothetical protein ACFVYE_36225 [Streptomyces sp. NPDC058239]|uniref:hypothetical protein n=1 Tax=Streptomyces sp. NPDC058239 TaxID=3346395 RepID=UPI0036E00291
MTNYLRPDPATREWAEGVMADALADAEQAARDAHAEVVRRRGSPTVILMGSTPNQLTGAGLTPGTAHGLSHWHLDTAWSACGDFQHHPETGLTRALIFSDGASSVTGNWALTDSTSTPIRHGNQCVPRRAR